MGWVYWVKGGVELATNPAKKFLMTNRAAVQNKLGGLGKINKTKELEQRQQVLSLENEALKLKITELSSQNEAMRKLLGAPLPMDWNFIMANVLGAGRGEVMIDQGEKEGVLKDEVVIWEKVLVGKIKEVSPHAAKVKTPLDESVAILAKTEKANGVTAIEEGELFLTKILQKEELSVGDLVMTSGGEGIYPANLFIGKIEKVIVEPEQPFKKAKLIPLVDYSDLKVVFLIKN